MRRRRRRRREEEEKDVGEGDCDDDDDDDNPFIRNAANRHIPLIVDLKFRGPRNVFSYDVFLLIRIP